MTLENITTSGNIFQYHMVFEKAIFIFHVTFFNVTWKMKLLLQYYTFRKKISNNIFFGPILMELHFLFMNEKYTTLGILNLTRKGDATQPFSRPLGFLAIDL